MSIQFPYDSHWIKMHLKQKTPWLKTEPPSVWNTFPDDDTMINTWCKISKCWKIWLLPPL